MPTPSDNILDDRLLAWAAGDDLGADAQAIERLLATSERARRVVALYRLVRESMRPDGLPELDAATVARLRAIGRGREAAQGVGVAGLVSWWRRAERVLLETFFDSGHGAALAGVRGEAVLDGFQRSCRGCGMQVDLQFEPAGAAAAAARRWRVVGQVVPEDPALPARSVAIAILRDGDDAEPLLLRGDDRGVFTCLLDAGVVEILVEPDGAAPDGPRSTGPIRLGPE